MIEKGTVLRCKTQTFGDTFGIVLWEVVETGLQAPEKGRENQKDGVKVVMLGGSGANARSGITLTDSEAHIQQDIDAGITTIVPSDKREDMLLSIKKMVKSAGVGNMPKHCGAGVIEI
jgi:hypothetical protein